MYSSPVIVRVLIGSFFSQLLSRDELFSLFLLPSSPSPSAAASPPFFVIGFLYIIASLSSLNLCVVPPASLCLVVIVWPPSTPVAVLFSGF